MCYSKLDNQQAFTVVSPKGEETLVLWYNLFFKVFKGRRFVSEIYMHKVREGRKKILGIEPLSELAHVLCVFTFGEG